MLQIIADENHTLFPGLAVKGFPLPVGSNIPVQHKDIHVGIDFFQFQGDFMLWVQQTFEQ
jgi:hypothetical protein